MDLLRRRPPCQDGTAPRWLFDGIVMKNARLVKSPYLCLKRIFCVFDGKYFLENDLIWTFEV
jgi:hypothetical protein